MRATSLLVFSIWFATAAAAEPQELAKQFEVDIRPFMQTYCADCHTGDDPEAGIALETRLAPDIAAEFEKWTLILQKVGGHEMPPEDADQPSDRDRQLFLDWIDAGLATFDCNQHPSAARATVRRLNRFEYNNVIEDLFGLSVTPADDFPADDVGEGFDNIGEVLSLPPLLMEKYLDAAERVALQLGENEAAWSRVFPKLVGDFDNSTVRSSIARLARSAFRRPISNRDLDPLMSLYQLAGSKGMADRAAVQFVVQAILVSPQFLFRVEEDQVEDGRSVPLDSHSIASRLSFFLWSTIPDQELNDLADRGELTKPEVIASQARRMLQHDRARALVDNFAGQWLELRLLAAVRPDPDLFPTFDPALRAAMIEETSRYFLGIVHHDKSVLDLIDSDYTYLNHRLAQHYDIDGVDGDTFQLVRFADDNRGGILTHASILTLTSNPTRTSPVKRGKWILDNILGTPPPPPPPNVPELEEGDELLGSLRERMQQHRENPSCAVCHRKMDALGFGFENFDAIGSWRDRDGRYEIDASGELPGGILFNNPGELRKILKSNSNEFTSCLTRKLLIYALGRALSSRDECLVDDIVEYAANHGHRFSELIVAIVTSDTFRFSGDGETGEQP